MSLQVWLPLNGSVENQGLKNVTIVNVDATVNNNGKTGQCYYFNGTSARIAASAATFSFPMSICAWIKGEQTTTGSTQYIFSYDTATGGSSGHNIGIGIYGGYLSIWHGGVVTASTTQLTNNVWYHIAAVVTASSFNLYLNGEKITYGSETLTNVNSLFITLGARSASSTGGSGNADYFFKGYINDARFYTRALSSADIKEIYKGLILHYPLNDATHPNLLSSDPNQVSSWVQSGVTLTQEINGSLKCVTDSDGEKRIYNRTSNVWTAVGNVYTVSFIAKASTNGITLRVSRSLADYAPNITLTTNWKLYSTLITITDTASAGTLSILGVNAGDTFWLCNVKLENGTIATPYILPNTIKTKIYDISGFRNYGSIDGSLTATTNTKRYNAATVFDNQSFIKNQDFIYTSNVLSVSCWFQKTSSITTNFETMIGLSRNTGVDADKKFSMYIKDNVLGFVLEGTAHSALTIDKTKWHHVCITNDGNTQKYYLDGVLQATFSGTANLTDCTDLVIGGRAASNNATTIATPWGGNISDVRIYATALSADDVAALYRMGV